MHNYFSDLLDSNNAADTNAITNSEIVQPTFSPDNLTQELIHDSLNRDITFEEVKNICKKLKNRKTTGIDMLSAELLKNLNSRFLLVFTKLFNNILHSGKFSEEWSVGIIVIIFKGGDKSDLNNYKGIMLLSIFGKFFLGILLKRLNTVISTNSILNENQIGF